MKTLNSVKWGEILFKDLFDIKPGVRLTKDDMTEGLRPFIGATDSNNGITAFCGNTNKSLDSNCLGVNYNGSVVENFYHPYEALFSDDVKHMHLKSHKGNKYIYLFLKNLILKQKDKYQYGYKFNGERMLKQTLLIPIDDDGSPDFKFMEQYMRGIEKKLLKRYARYLENKGFSLLGNSCIEEGKIDNAERWKPLSINEIFPIIQRGKRLKNEDHIPGNMPYVSSSAINNGIDDFVSNEEKVRTFNDCITIANSGSVGASFYHPYTFVASDHVTQLKRQNSNKYIYLFLATISYRLSEKYSFNREINETRIKREKLLVPTTPDGSPDYNFMEQQMREKEQKLIRRYIEYRLKKV